MVGKLSPFWIQKTLASSVECEGVGVHSGARVSLRLHPGSAHGGIVFLRRLSDGSLHRIPARWDYVGDTKMCTTLSLPRTEGQHPPVILKTVEHLMAAFAGCGVDNALVEVDSEEMPILDGSSAPFVELIKEAGIVSLGVPAKRIRILKPVTLQRGEAELTLLPSDTPSFHVTFDGRGRLSALLGDRPQKMSFSLEHDDFAALVAPARTFGFYEDAQKLWSHGLALGASMDNTVVIHEGAIMNPDGLRYGDEFVRHKLLDAIGDLALAGARLVGRFEGINPGHELNNLLLRKVLEDPKAWEFCQNSYEATESCFVRFPTPQNKEVAFGGCA